MNPVNIDPTPTVEIRPASPPLPRWVVWYQRVTMAVRVVIFIYLGLVLVVVPWTRLWTENSLLAAHPMLRAFVHHNFVRGVVTGLGLIDLWFGIWEAVQYHDPRSPADLPGWLQ